MRQPERLQPEPHDDIRGEVGLYVARVQLGDSSLRLSKEEQEATAAWFKREITQPFQSNLPLMRNQVLSRSDTVPLVTVCSFILGQCFKGVNEICFPDALLAGTPATAASIYDFNLGAMVALNNISMASCWEKFGGRFPDWFSLVISAWQEISGDVVTATGGSETYTQILTVTGRAVELLQEDPTGVKVIDDFIQRLENGEEKTGLIHNPDLVIAGARCARELYQTLYQSCTATSA